MTDNHSLRFISPYIVKAGQLATVNIAAQWFTDRHITPPDTVIVSNVSGHPAQTMREMPDQVPLQAVDGGFQLTSTFAAEGEYVVLIDAPAGIETVALYALEPDLYNRRPFRGDVHMHSNRSDGKEHPAYVAAACRRIGLDFMALTDHWQYAPSLEAIQAFAHLPVDLRIYPGEEVHVPRLPISEGTREGSTPVHIINFGGRFSVNDWIHNHESTFETEVQTVMQQLEDYPLHVDRRSYAECVWSFDKIREAGGLGIFCHPYWYTRHRYDVPETLTDLLFDRQPYDALELIGGYYRSETVANHLQVARYHEERSHGKRIPIVGVSDAHGCDTGKLFGWYTTLVFSPSADFSDLTQSIMDLYSVAVVSVPGSDEVAHGPFRLVKYAQFLLREILPAHNELCYEEGLHMQAYLNKDEGAMDKLQAWSGRTADFYQHIWGSPPAEADTHQVNNTSPHKK